MAYFASGFYTAKYWQADYFNAGGATPGAVVSGNLGAGGGKAKPIPRIRLLDGRLYQPGSRAEFQRLYAAIVRRTGSPPETVVPVAAPVPPRPARPFEPKVSFSDWAREIEARYAKPIDLMPIRAEISRLETRLAQQSADEEEAIALLLLSLE